ncbi:MAG: hypothetical protein ACPGYT_04815 [Nitrospirales bacterium]
MPVPPDLLTLTHYLDGEDIPDSIHELCESLLHLYPKGIQAILFYGSCLRSDSDVDGIVDLYVIVDRYGSIYKNSWLTIANTLLPPNVFYLEIPYQKRTIRAKYAILSIKDFERSTSKQWFHSYFWARFAQPTKVVFAKTPVIQKKVYAALAQAILTFTMRTIYHIPNPFDALGMWKAGLSLTYQAELRTERSGRIEQLLTAAPDYYQQTGDIAIANLSIPIVRSKPDEPEHYTTEHDSFNRRLSQGAWILRRLQGKLLSVLRLLKGFFTFQGGVAYILWKIERHSGVKITLTPWQQRHPLLSCPTVLWQLYHKGAFR